MNVQHREEAVVARLRALAPSLDDELDTEFRDRTRSRLVAMAAVREPAAAPVPRWRRLLAARAPDAAADRRGARLTTALAGAALSVTVLATLVAVATDARPGDALYGLKRGTEETQLALAGDARGRTLLELASTRLDELRSLATEPAGALPAAGAGDATDDTPPAAGTDAELVIATLDTMDEQTVGGAVWLADRSVRTADAGPMVELSSWSLTQSARLARIAPALPGEAAVQVTDSLDLLTAVTARALALQEALVCPSGAAVAGRDALGPLPAPCEPVAPETVDPGPSDGAEPTDPVPPAEPAPTGDPLAPEVPDTPLPPTPAPSAGPGQPGTGSGGQPPPSRPSLPVPLPPLPLPAPQTPIVEGPPLGPIQVCLPPLVTLGC